MKIIAKLFLVLLLVIIISPILILSYLGFIPGLSSVFGSDKPRNLGIKYTEADRVSGRAKSQIEYGTLPADTPDVNSLVRVGTRAVKTEFTSAEITALANNRPWKYWPFSNVQVKFNADGSAEMSGVVLKDKLPGYGAFIGAPKQAVEFALKFLPSNPIFYLKMKASLVNNKVAVFEPQTFEIGRAPLPLNMFLSFVPKQILEPAYASSVDDMSSELSKVSDKRAKIIEYINQRLSLIQGFYAKNASFGDNKLIFDGNLAEKELTVR